MAAPSPLTQRHVIALRFLVGVGSATALNVGAAVNSQLSPLRGFGLAQHISQSHEASDLVMMGLAHQSGAQYSPTERGTQLLASIDSASEVAGGETFPETAVLVGVPSERIFYSEILSQIVTRDDVLFIDPYLSAQDLKVLIKLTAVTRVLTGPRPVADRGEKNDVRRAEALAVVAGSRPGLEVRLSTEIHDRYVLPLEGAGMTIGASLGSKKITTAVELSPQMTLIVRERQEAIWDRASVLEAITYQARDETVSMPPKTGR